MYAAIMGATNSLMAVKAGSHGDVSATAVEWKFHKSIPQLPSVVLYRGVIYMINDSGVLTTLDAKTGEVFKQARLALGFGQVLRVAGGVGRENIFRVAERSGGGAEGGRGSGNAGGEQNRRGYLCDAGDRGWADLRADGRVFVLFWLEMKFLASIVGFALMARAASLPTAAEREQITSKLAQLTRAIDELRAKHVDEARLADIEVYQKAATWALRFEEEFFTPAYVPNALQALDHGLARAADAAFSWESRKGRIVRGYRSKVDGSVQPYGLIIPESYDGSKAVRLDVVLHGRGTELTEVSFIAAHESDKPVTQDYITLEVYGRGNNAYRWAGETDVFEAIDSVKARYKIDEKKIVLRGFSMGGAGAWHIGLHFPGQVGRGGGGRGIHGDEEVREARADGGVSGSDAADLRRGGLCGECADGADGRLWRRDRSAVAGEHQYSGKAGRGAHRAAAHVVPDRSGDRAQMGAHQLGGVEYIY